MSTGEAEVFGTRLARIFAAGALAHELSTEAVSNILEILTRAPSQMKTKAMTRMAQHIVELFKAGPNGHKHRVLALTAEVGGLSEAKMKAHEMLVKGHENKDPDVVDTVVGIMRAAELSDYIAKGIEVPVQAHYNALVSSAVRAKAARLHREQTMDDMHDNKCDDPNCEAHFKH
jgi:hypothetical protein